MTISVVVPIYKVEAFLHRCVDSILAQSFRDYELILVDDGSPDKCGEMCDAYAQTDGRIRVIHQKNGGRSAARNAGINIAAGEWITFIDSDDWIHPDYLKLLLSAARSGGAEIAGGRFQCVREDTPVDDTTPDVRFSVSAPEEFWLRDRTNATVAWGKLYRRVLFQEIRYPAGKVDEDEFTTYRLLFGTDRIAFVDAPIYRYYQNENGISKMDYLRLMDDAVEAFYGQYRFFAESEYRGAYLLSLSVYADSLSQGIRAMQNDRTGAYREKLKQTKEQLKAFLKEHSGEIPFEKNKEIYMTAYPSQALLIRGFGFLKQRLGR